MISEVSGQDMTSLLQPGHKVTYYAGIVEKRRKGIEDIFSSNESPYTLL